MDTKRESSAGANSTTPPWQLDLLLQKLRQKSKGSTLIEAAKNVRSSLLERRCIVDPVENQTCLDQLQQSIKVDSLQTMVDKLEMITRQQGLKFTRTNDEWFISSDMFYLELLIDGNGVVREVKIQHEGKSEQQSCPEIVDSLLRHDFKDLAAHLEGLVSIYQLSADKNTKSKLFRSFQALEADLSAMASTYSHLTDGEMVVMKSLLGLVRPRKGGHPVKLVFYVSPYELLDVEASVSAILEHKLGAAATVSVQAYTSQKLQMTTTVSISRTPDGKSIPRYLPLNTTNSTWLNACFSLNLQNPIPVCHELLQAIQTTTGIQSFDTTELAPLLNLITKYVSKELLDCSTKEGLFVTLPDQNHCYFMTETENLEGMMISSIPFTLASNLPQVFATLRQQLAFNTLIASCVRVDSSRVPDSIIFEINALSHQNLTVSFQHPLEDELVTLEFDLRDVTHPTCHLHATPTASDIIPTLEEYACKVVHRTMSIPVTTRAVIRRWEAMKIKADPPNPSFNLRVGSSFNPKSSLSQPPSDLSCAAESERLSQQTQQTQQVPGMVMNWGNAAAAVGLTPNSSFTISPVNPVQTTTFPNQTPMELVSPYITLSNFQNQLINSTMVNMLASQISNQQQGVQKQSSSVLMNLLDQVGQQNRRRKRKVGMSESSSGQGQTNMPMPRPSPSPSPKSPRMPSAKRSPKRRPSEGSEDSSPRVPTPTTPSSNSALGHMMSEMGLESDPRWNIDITPVGPGLDTTFSKMLSHLGSEYQSLDDSDIEIESEVQGKYPLKLLKKQRDIPKRSMSLDSSVKDHGSAGNVQSLLENSSEGFKPLVTPSLSITPVNSTANTSATVNSILASMRPGIEIIPLPNPVTIPHSITVTPILPKPSPGEKNNKCGTSTDELDGKRNESSKKPENRKRKLDELSSKSLSFGPIQMKPISKPPGVGGLKRSNSVNPPRHVLPKGTNNLVPSAALAALAKSGGKPSVSTLKSVSVSPTNTSSPQQGLPKPKINRDKTKGASSAGPPPKLQKIQQTPSSGTKIESTHGPPVPKLEPMVSVPLQGVKPEQPNASKQDHVTKSASMMIQKIGAAATGGVKKAGLLAVIDKLKSQQHSADDVAKKDSAKTVAGTGSGNPPGGEYTIKPDAGGMGLKMTLNKKGTHSKDKLKFGGLKPGVPGLKKGLTPNRIPSPKLIAPSMTKKVKPDSLLMSGQIRSPSMSMKGSPTGALPKPKSEGELDLTKKLFMPGSSIFDGPKFDAKFQIPKKSRSVTTPVAEKVEDLTLPKKDKEEVIEVPSVSLTPPPVNVPAEQDAIAEPPLPTLTVAADVETSEKSDELPPVLSAEIHLNASPPPAMVADVVPIPNVAAKDDTTEISPESPDPVPMTIEGNDLTPTIPTTPVASLPAASPPLELIEAETTPSLPPDDEDQLVMDIPSENPPSTASNSQPEEKTSESPKGAVEDDEAILSMPPPPPPVESTPASPAAATPQPTTPLTVPIVSVHILHSPQPSSPALRSPLVVVQSPHSHPSPYAIDDELMDEALIG